MQISFDTMEVSVINGMRGGSGEVRKKAFADGENKIIMLTMAPGSTIGEHIHESSSETMYVLSGKGKVLCDGVWETLEPGACHYCPKGHGHYTVNDGTEDLVLFAIVPEHGN